MDNGHFSSVPCPGEGEQGDASQSGPFRERVAEGTLAVRPGGLGAVAADGGSFWDGRAIRRGLGPSLHPHPGDWGPGKACRPSVRPSA